MGIGPRIGPAVGPRIGPAVGVSADPIVPPAASGSGDGPGGLIQAPMTAVGFAALTGRTPTHAYTCQEASGNLADQIGSVNLVAAGTPLYQQTIAGWTRKGVGFNETLNQRFAVGAGSGPNATVTPVAMLIYFTCRTPAAMRNMLILSDAGATARSCALNGVTGLLRTQCAATTNDGVVDHRDGAVHPLLLTLDIAGSNTNRYTDLEKDNGTFAAGVLDGNKGIGALTGLNSHLGEVAGLWIFEGTDAQFTDAQAKALLQGLGWSIPWT